MYMLHKYLANELCNNKSLGALTYFDKILTRVKPGEQ